MKVLFLDVDGVLNKAWTPTRDDAEGHLIATDPLMVFLVNNAVDKYGFKVVLSSSWRHMPDWREQLKANGIVFEFLDRTPLDGKEEQRGGQIRRWLEANPWVEKYAILDDYDWFEDAQRPNLFRTNYMCGLTEDLMVAVVKHLTE